MAHLPQLGGNTFLPLVKGAKGQEGGEEYAQVARQAVLALRKLSGVEIVVINIYESANSTTAKNSFSSYQYK